MLLNTYYLAMILFEDKKVNNKTCAISFLGIPIYEIEHSENYRVQKFLGNFLVTRKSSSKIGELKTFEILGLPISKRIVESDTCSYYCFGILVSRNSLAKIFFNKNLKNIKTKYDDVYILNSNSGEVYLFFAYLVKSFIEKNKSKNPLFVATQKYHIDILKMYYPKANYIFVNKLNLKTQSLVWNTPNHRYFILFPANHFEKIEKDISENEIGTVHYFSRMLETLQLTEKDFSKPHVISSEKVQKFVNNATCEMQLQVDNFIILAPEAMTCEDLPITFWQKVVQELKNKNFDIYLNITKPTNYIEGGKHYNLGFEEAFFLAQKAKAVISLRSGFSEFLLPTEIPNISIYTKFRNRTKNTFSVDKGIEGFSMLKMPFVDKNKVCEINAELYKNEDELVKQVIDSLEMMLNKKECLL